MFKNSKDKVLKELESFIDNLVNQNNSLKDKLNNYKKDEEIKKLIDANNAIRMNSIHVLSDKERYDAKTFGEDHYKSCKSNVQYIFEGTGIGTSVVVKCIKCQAIKSVTDIDNW